MNTYDGTEKTWYLQKGKETFTVKAISAYAAAKKIGYTLGDFDAVANS